MGFYLNKSCFQENQSSEIIKMNIGVSLLLLLTLVVAVCGKKSSGPIYHKTDDVVILDAENFRTKVINSTSSWFIMFYSQWCGHCKEFAPIYKKLATDMKEWKFLKLGVVDCSAKSEKNKRDNGMGLCFKRPYFIGGMPDCRFFPAHSDKDSKGERRKFLGKKVYGSDGKLKEDSDSFEHVQKSIVNFLQDHHFKENSLNMEFLKRKDIESLADGHGKENLVLIIEPRSSIVGQLITLDLADSNVTVGRISSRNRKAVTSLHERFSVEIQEQQMCAVVITAERKPKVIYGSHQEDGELRKMVARYVMMEPTVLTSEGEGTDKEPIDDDVNTNSDEEEKVFMADLEIALTYSLRKEVAGKEVIEKDDLLNLKNYINVIVEFFPGRKQTMKFLRKIRKLATSRSSIDWESWQQILLRAKKHRRRVLVNQRRFGASVSFVLLATHAHRHDAVLSNSTRHGSTACAQGDERLHEELLHLRNMQEELAGGVGRHGGLCGQLFVSVAVSVEKAQLRQPKVEQGELAVQGALPAVLEFGEGHRA